MESSLREVLEGEYDAPYFGDGLTIVDVGANVGSFSLWADLRWPRSTIHAYEPNPSTFDMLVRNVGHLPNIRCEQVAVYTSEHATERLISRYAGDGEAGLVDAMATTWRALPTARMMDVPVRAPRDLPAADSSRSTRKGPRRLSSRACGWRGPRCSSSNTKTSTISSASCGPRADAWNSFGSPRL